MSPFIDKIFESITIEAIINNKKCILCNYYRSPSPVQNMSSNDQLNEFVDVVDNLSSHLSNLNTPTYIFSDSNLNLLNFSSTEHSENYLHSLHSNGFLLTNFKASRMYKDSFSLIDHIFSNNINPNIETGSVIDDISDHFVNFIQIPYTKNKKTNINHASRIHTPNAILMFRDALRSLNWLDVVSSQDVNTSCNNFWQTFKPLYDIHFPIAYIRPNKNIYKINNFMTKGLLISRINKNKLHKSYLSNPTPVSFNNFKTYRNIYNALIRKSKKLHHQQQLRTFKHNPKKTWSMQWVGGILETKYLKLTSTALV